MDDIKLEKPALRGAMTQDSVENAELSETSPASSILNLVLGVVGLGKLGSPMAAVFAEAGFNVIGGDINQDYVDTLNQGHPPIDETGLAETLKRGKVRLRATSDLAALGEKADVIFIIVPTPSSADHTFSNDYIIRSIDMLAPGLKSRKNQVHIVITSTVMPGSTGGVIKDALEKSTGYSVGPHMGLSYNPEFIALGSVIHDMHYPDFILIGENDQKWGDQLEAIYRIICRGTPGFERMNHINAEITKISVNTFTTTKISYANMLSEICQCLPGADVDVVAHAVGADSRVGRKYLKGGVGFGGPCFPRDNRAFVAMAHHAGAKADLAEATDVMNCYQLERYLKAAADHINIEDAIGILGLAYKPNTAVTEASQGWGLALELAQCRDNIHVFDPLVAETPDGCIKHDRLADFIAAVDAVFVMLPLDQEQLAIIAGRDMSVSDLYIIDPWRCCKTLSQVSGIRYMPLGVGKPGMGE